MSLAWSVLLGVRYVVGSFAAWSALLTPLEMVVRGAYGIAIVQGLLYYGIGNAGTVPRLCWSAVLTMVASAGFERSPMSWQYVGIVLLSLGIHIISI